MIHGLFPTPILELSLSRDISSLEMDFALKHKKDAIVNMSGNRTSTNNLVLDCPEMHSIKEFALKGLNEFMNSIIDPIDKPEMYITQSWFNYTDAGQGHHRHDHGNSILSGVIYFNADSKRDNISFYKQDPDYILHIPTERFNPFNSPSWWLPVETGKMYIFSSKLQHSVDIVKDNETRISLAFNSFIRGDIGSKVNLTHLKL